MRDHATTEFAVYFDTVDAGRGNPRRFAGLIGDGDYFREGFKRREINASHFDQFVDFDADGDLDLFKGGVEPFVSCYENVGKNRMVERGRLTSAGKVFTLPKSNDNRSWVTVAFYDIDRDGDQDFFPSFNDGPDSGKIVFYRNTTPENGGRLTFERVGPLKTKSGRILAGGAQAGGWFPSIAFIEDWDGESDGGMDALVGSNHRCWLYRNAGWDSDGAPRFEEAVPIQADGKDIVLTNPRFDVADIDGDGDLDLFAGTQPGPIYLFRNVGSRRQPRFTSGTVVAFGGKYLIGDAHSGVKVADFDGDGLLDFVAGRFWERTNLSHALEPRCFGEFYRNIGTASAPTFARHGAEVGAPFTEQFQICDAVRQNCVRAVDWDQDGRMDLLAGDTDGFIWFSRNESSGRFPVFATGEKIRVGDGPLSVAATGGHARFDVCDWDNDGRLDLLVTDGSGALTVFHNRGGGATPRLAAGEQIQAGGNPLQGKARASVLVCDWDNDGRKDVVFADQSGFHFCRNLAADADPVLAAPTPILFQGKPVSYVRPNLGSFVDWDGDGRKDFIGCHFENSVRFYRNMASGARGEKPQFADPEGVVILRGSSPQMISGADVVDWNGDGDLAILTGQGHGGSGLRFFERDWIEDELRNTHPVVSVQCVEQRGGASWSR